MASAAADPVAALLRRTSLPQVVRAAAWDAFEAADSPQDLTPRLKRLPLPQGVRAALWDLKARHMGGQMAFRANVPKQRVRAEEPVASAGPVSSFIDDHFQHFNARTLRTAAEAYVAHLADGGQMFLSMAGAMSTAELGRSLAPMIRERKISGMSVTGANLEEDLFVLLGHDDYRGHPTYHQHTPAQDAALGEEGMPRVTDVSIPEESAMQPLEDLMRVHLAAAETSGERVFPHQMLYDMVRRGELADHYQGEPSHSWVVAAATVDLPLFVPGWEDSTLGNVFAADCVLGRFQPSLVKGGIDYMMELAEWYRRTAKTHDLGFCQLGGGIAADFAICVVPMFLADLHQPKMKKWAYFCQFSAGHESYGGYSDALPNEKASWLKLPPDAPMFDIKGDMTINFPLFAALVLGW